jgi:hypothetical protein
MLHQEISKKHTMRGQLGSHGNIVVSLPEFHPKLNNLGRFFPENDRMSLFQVSCLKWEVFNLDKLAATIPGRAAS